MVGRYPPGGMPADAGDVQRELPRSTNGLLREARPLAPAPLARFLMTRMPGMALFSELLGMIYVRIEGDGEFLT